MTEQVEIENLKQQLAKHRDAVQAAASSLSSVSTGDFLINVKRDFGAVGDNSADDTIAIQNAIGAAGAAGGKIIFPRGLYRISNSLLTQGGTYANIVLEGEGGMPGTSGSGIVGNFNDWLIKNGYAQTNMPQHAIVNVNFQQNYQGALGTDTDHTAGCINWGSGLGGYIKGCNIDIWSGVGIYAAADCIEIANCNTTGHFDRSDPQAVWNSIGIWTTGHVHGGKHTSLAYGAVFTDNGGQASNMMLDTCGQGVVIGSAPIGWLQNPMEANVPQPKGWSYISKSVHLRNTTHESCLTGVYVGRGRHVFAEGVAIANYMKPDATAGISIDDFCDRSVFRGVDISGAFSEGGVLLGSSWGGGRAAGTKFIDCNVNNAAGRTWSYKGDDINTRVLAADSTGQDPCVFENCPGLDDAINVSQLPSSPSSSWLQTVKDSADPIWTGSASNAGKPVEGGGSNRTYVRWNGAAWVLA